MALAWRRAADRVPASIPSGFQWRVPAWAVGGGANGSSLDPIAPSFPAGIESWLVAGPINLANATDAFVNLDLFYESDGNDPFTISVSQDRFFFTEELTIDQIVPTGSWEQKTVSLTDYVGKPAKPHLPRYSDAMK